MPIWPRGGLWREGDFLRLWAAQGVSALGSRVSRTALPMIAILTLQASLIEQALLAALSTAPGLIAGLLVGGRLDRGRKRPLLIWSDLVRAALILSVPAAAWSGWLGMPQLYLVAAITGAATAVFEIADNAYLPSLIDKDRLVEGNSKLEATDAVAEAAGPGLAGLLIQALSAPGAMLVDGLSYLWSAWLIGRVRKAEAPPESAGRASLGEDIAEGFRLCWADAGLRALLLAECGAWLAGGAFAALYMATVLSALSLSPLTSGLIISCGGIGAVAGASLAGPLASRLGTFGAAATALLAGQAFTLLIPLALHWKDAAIPLLVLHQLAGDALLTAFLVLAVSYRQAQLPSAAIGRGMASFHVATGAALTLGTLTAGLAAEAVGLSPVLWAGAAIGIAAALALSAAAARSA